MQRAAASGAASGQGVSKAAPFVSRQPGIRGLLSLLEHGRASQGMAAQQLTYSTIMALLPTSAVCAGFLGGSEVATKM